MAKVAKKKKKNYRLRKSVRRTLGALFMMTAIIVAAIPFPDAAATDDINQSQTPATVSTINKITDTYNYTESSADSSTLTNFFDGIVTGGELKVGTGETPSVAYAIRQTSDGKDYMLIKQFELVQRSFDGIPGGVITKYYDTYQAESVILPSSVTTKYKTVSETEYDTYYAGDGSKSITLDLSEADIKEDVVDFFETFYPTELATYRTEYATWSNADPATRNPVAPVLTRTPANMNPERKLQYYCYKEGLDGFTLYSVIDRTTGSAVNSRVYLMKAINVDSHLPSGSTFQMHEGFIVEGTTSILAVGEQAFYQVGNVVAMTLPGEIKYVANEAFYNSFIDKVILDGATLIGHRAFKNCTDLQTVELPNATKIGVEAFYGCNELESMVFTDAVGLIESGAYANCTSLNSVDFSQVGGTNTSVGEGAFYNCPLGNMNVGTSKIASVGKGAFAINSPGIDQMTSLDFSKSNVNEIGEMAFSGRSKLISITMPGAFGNGSAADTSKNKLPSNVFAGCSNLGKVIFPEESAFVEYDNNIFTNVANDQFVVEGPATNNYGQMATQREDTWECINYNGNPVPYTYVKDGQTFYEVRSTDYLLTLTVNNSDLTATVIGCDFVDEASGNLTGELEIPQKVGPYKIVKLGNDCFSDDVKESFKKLEFADNSIEEIGDSVFAGCTSVKEVIIGNSVSSIGVSAFEGCTSLDTLNIGSGIKEIKDKAFKGCKSLKYITFDSPAGGASDFPVGSIGSEAFSTGGLELTVTGILEEGYAPFEWAMDPTNYVDPSMGIRVCYKTPAPQRLTVILDNQNNLPTLVDYPHYDELEAYTETVVDSEGNETTVTTDLRSKYENKEELTPHEEGIINATLYIDIPAGIDSIDVSGYLTDKSNTMGLAEPKTNGFNVSTYFNHLKYKKTYADYGLFGGEYGDSNEGEYFDAVTGEHGDDANEIIERGNDCIRSITMHTVKYLPTTDNLNLPSEEGQLTGGAFYSCENLETVDLGSEMEDVGTLPFLGCYNLSSVASTSPKYTCENKILYENGADGNLSIVECLGSRGNASDGTVSLETDPNLASVVNIEPGAFMDCPTLRRVYFDELNGITEIPDDCFNGSGNLSDVVLPVPVRTIGQRAFANGAQNVTLTIYGREVSLATDAFANTDGAQVVAYKDSAAYNTALKMKVDVLPLDETYKVQFFDYDGVTPLTDIQYIEEGKDAEPPEEEPTRQGYLFTGWNKSYKDVIEDMDIIALYETDPEYGSTGGGAGNNPGGGNINGGVDTDGDGIPDTDANGNKLYKLTVTNGEGSGSYPAGKTVTIKAGNAPKGSTFAYWSCSNENVIFEDATKWITTLTMVSSDVTVIANYTGQYTLEVEYGSGSGSYPAGTKVAISAVEAPQGRKFASWVSRTSGLTVENSKKESTVITMPASNAKITATYMDTGSISGNSTSKPSQNGTQVIITKPGISDKDTASAYVSGSSDNFIVKISESLDAADEVQKALQKKYPDMTRIKYFAMDISLYDAKGVNKITDTTGLKVNITMPIPDALREYAGNNRVGAVVNGELETLNPKFTTINGVPSVTFTATHFSPYTIYVDTGNLTVGNTLDSTPKTGDGIHPKWFVSIALACISIILFTKRDRRYTVKAYR